MCRIRLFWFKLQNTKRPRWVRDNGRLPGTSAQLSPLHSLVLHKPLNSLTGQGSWTQWHSLSEENEPQSTFLDLQWSSICTIGERLQWGGVARWFLGSDSSYYTSFRVEFSYLWWHSIVTFFYFTWDIDRQASLTKNLEILPILLQHYR